MLDTSGQRSIRANGRPNGRAWRQLYCWACGQYFLETHGTLFYGKQHSPETILYAIGCLAEGLVLRATARVFAIEAKTLLGWLVEAAEHSAVVSQYSLQDLRVSQIQLDELFALVAEWRGQEPNEAEATEALERLPRRPRWVWTAIDPVSKVWLHWSVGERTLTMAQAFVHQLLERLRNAWSGPTGCRITNSECLMATCLCSCFGVSRFNQSNCDSRQGMLIDLVQCLY